MSVQMIGQPKGPSLLVILDFVGGVIPRGPLLPVVSLRVDTLTQGFPHKNTDSYTFSTNRLDRFPFFRLLWAVTPPDVRPVNWLIT